MKDNEAVDLLTSLLVIVPAAAIAPVMFDLATGAGYTVRPPYDLNVTLTKADGLPRVDTTLIDADDLRNVKWIRGQAILTLGIRIKGSIKSGQCIVQSIQAFNLKELDPLVDVLTLYYLVFGLAF